MPITAPAVTTAILTAGPTLAGTTWVRTATGIGVAVQAWLATPGNVVINGAVAGVVGGGAVTGKAFVVPAPLPVNFTVAAASLLGVDAQLAATAVGFGVSIAVNASAVYVGTSVGAIGAEVSKVTYANGASLTALIAASFAAQGLNGPVALQFAGGLGPGIAGIMLTGVGTGVAVGPGGPLPGVGTSISNFVV